MTCLSDAETWKDVPGYEGIYQASTLGRIRTVEGKTTYTQRHGVRKWKSRVLKCRGHNPKTGFRISLWKDGCMKDALVARVVAITFLGEPPEGFTVNHIDGNRFNNCIDNLEWLSLADNIRHGFATGLYRCKKAVAIEREGLIFEFDSLANLSRFLGRGARYASNAIKRGHTLRDVQGNVYKLKKGDFNE